MATSALERPDAGSKIKIIDADTHLTEPHDMWLKRTPGGLETLPEADQTRVRNARDPQLERAMDFLKTLSIYSGRQKGGDVAAAPKSEAVATP